jgi:hypothetical protein
LFARKLSQKPGLTKTLNVSSKIHISTKSENRRVEEVLPRGQGPGRCPKQCMHRQVNAKNNKVKIF